MGMIADLVLVPVLGEPKSIKRTFKWDDELQIQDGKSIKVERLSIYDHQPIIDGVTYRVAHMFSKPVDFASRGADV